MNERTIIKKLTGLLPSARFRHSLRVRDMAVKLSKFHNISVQKACIAGLLHDASRYLDRKGMLAFAKQKGLRIDRMARLEPKLLHARISAYIAKNDFGIRDKDILRAISSHTLGRKNMSSLEKVIYIADHVETGRKNSGVKQARKLAVKDLDMAVVAIASSMIQYLKDKGLQVHPCSQEVRDHYIKNNEQKAQRAGKTK